MASDPAHVFRGRGLWIWDVGATDVAKACQRAKNARFDYVLVKAQDGLKTFNSDGEIHAVKTAAHQHGLAFGLWGYLLAAQPAAEAKLACSLVDQYKAAFYVADVEAEYEAAQGPVSSQFVHAFRALHSHLPAACSSFGRIDLHPGMDWAAWRDGGFAFMPQAYEGMSSALTPAKCLAAARVVWPVDQIHPTLGPFSENGSHRPTPAELASSIKGLPTHGISVWEARTATAQDLTALRPPKTTAKDSAAPVVHPPVAAGVAVPADGAPFRDFAVTSPMIAGPDVLTLQLALNQRRKARKLFLIDTDSQYGEETHQAAFQTAWALGITKSPVPNHAVTSHMQQLLRDPKRRTATQLAAAKARAKQVAGFNKGPSAALDYARAHLGVVESPQGSNHGKQIDAWGKVFGAPQTGPGWEWCGVFVGACLHAAGVMVPTGIQSVATIVSWADQGINGMTKGHIAVRDAAPGDLVAFDWKTVAGPSNHVAMVEKNLGNGHLQTIAGNTHPDGAAGSGYGVFRRNQSTDIQTIVRPRYSAA